MTNQEKIIASAYTGTMFFIDRKSWNDFYEYASNKIGKKINDISDIDTNLYRILKKAVEQDFLDMIHGNDNNLNRRAEEYANLAIKDLHAPYEAIDLEEAVYAGLYDGFKAGYKAAQTNQ